MTIHSFVLFMGVLLIGLLVAKATLIVAFLVKRK